MFNHEAPATNVTRTLVCSPDQERISRWREQCASDVRKVRPRGITPTWWSLWIRGVEGHESPGVGNWSLWGWIWCVTALVGPIGANVVQ